MVVLKQSLPSSTRHRLAKPLAVTRLLGSVPSSGRNRQSSPWRFTCQLSVAPFGAQRVCRKASRSMRSANLSLPFPSVISRRTAALRKLGEGTALHTSVVSEWAKSSTDSILPKS